MITSMHSAGASAAKAFVGLTTTAEAVKAIQKLLDDIHGYFTGDARRKREQIVLRQEGHLKNAVARLQSIDSRISGAQQYQKDVLSQLGGYADLSQMMVGSGYVGPKGTLLSGGAFLNYQLQQKLANLKKFATALKQMAQKKVSASLIKQVVAMGPDQGLLFAQEILAGGSSLINTLNKTEAQIAAEETTVSQMAASAAYGAGGALNFMAALRKQRAGIEKEVQHWAKVFGTEASKWFGVPRYKQPQHYQTGGTIPIGEMGFVGEAGMERVHSTPFGTVVEPMGGPHRGTTVVQNFYGPQYPTPEQRRLMSVEMTLALGVAP
jgi:hypothetical protein